jgi:LysM repeat protein
MFPWVATRQIILFGAALCFPVSSAFAEKAGIRCGPEVQVRAGEALSNLAERCGVTETSILDLNPDVRGSKDIRAGMTLNLAAPSPDDIVAKTREAADAIYERLKSYAEEVGQSIDRAAEATKQSMSEFIERNPDLHQRVRKLGHRLNIPGMEKVEAQVSLTVRNGAAGAPVTLSAIGLPAYRPVDIAGGPPTGDYQIIESARTSADGTLQVTVQLPSWADPQRDFIFVIAIPESSLAVRSAKFDVLQQWTVR